MKIKLGTLRKFVNEALSPFSSRKSVITFVYELISSETDLDADEVMLETMFNDKFSAVITRLSDAIMNAANDINDESGFYKKVSREDFDFSQNEENGSKTSVK